MLNTTCTFIKLIHTVETQSAQKIECVYFQVRSSNRRRAVHLFTFRKLTPDLSLRKRANTPGYQQKVREEMSSPRDYYPRHQQAAFDTFAQPPVAPETHSRLPLAPPVSDNFSAYQPTSTGSFLVNASYSRGTSPLEQGEYLLWKA